VSKSKNIFSTFLNPQPAVPHNDSAKTIRRAETEAKKIIIKATLKAKDIIENAEVLDELLEQELNQALQNNFEKISHLFEEKMNNSTEQVLSRFEELLEIQLKASQSLVLSSFEENLAKINDSLKIYEEKKRKQIDEILRLEAKELAKQIIGEIIPENLQEKLINEAIEKAKQEGVFQ
jgi:hypothetical protein